MKIGQEVWIHGYIDEMRKDIAIIKNDGGYFGAVYDEIAEAVEAVDKAYENGFKMGQAYRTEQYVIIDGVKYIAEKPMVKTIDQQGEIVISGFREEK